MQPNVLAKLLQSCLIDSAMLWTVAHQASLSMGFPRHEYWSRLPCPLSGDLPDPGIFEIQESNPCLLCLLYGRQILHPLSHQGRQIYIEVNHFALHLKLTQHYKSTMKVFVAPLCSTLCNPMDCSPPGSSVHGISQARILEWAAMPSSRGSSLLRDRTTSPALAGRFFTTKLPGKPTNFVNASPFSLLLS